MSHCRWNLLPTAPDVYPSGGDDLPPLLVQLLYNRGIHLPEDCQSFLSSDRSLAHDPWQLPDMEKAVARIYRTLLAGETIAVYGDFDADGITATATIVQGLSLLGGKTVPYIPHRQTEGHGLTTPVLRNLHENGASLVITVDCGVTDLLPVKKARRSGLDVIITDHHTPLSEIPEAVAVIDPKLAGAAYPFTQLAGVGVAYKLMEALYKSLGRNEPLEMLSDLVAIGTIADMSSLLGENRFLVSEGLRSMNTSPRLGVRELMQRTGISDDNISAERIAWVIAPCLNAAGRLADGLPGYRLLITDSPEEAGELAGWLVGKNEERQKLTSTTLTKAREQVTARGLPPLLVAADPEFPMGICGLVSGRLTEEFYRPSIVVQTGDKLSHASCRSIPEFDIIEALNRFSHYFTRYGGHAQAAGFTIPTRDLPKLERELGDLVAEQLSGVALQPHLDIDAEIKLNAMTGETYHLTRRLAPFGMSNPLPTFLSRGLEVLDKRTMGNGGDHLRLKLKQNDTIWDGVGFRQGAYLGEIASPLDIVYNLEIDNWQGRERLRLNILDFETSG